VVGGYRFLISTQKLLIHFFLNAQFEVLILTNNLF
jgi:hypothetical protein